MQFFKSLLLIFIFWAHATHAEIGEKGSKKYKLCNNILRSSINLPKCATWEDFLEGRGVPNADRPDGIIPPWANFELARKGQQFAKKWMASIIQGLIFGFFASPYPDAINLLISSGKTLTPGKAKARYLATITQILVWYDDPFLENEEVYETNSTLSDKVWSFHKVRSIHKNAARNAVKEKTKTGRLFPQNIYTNYTLTTGLSGAFQKDLKVSKIPHRMRALPATHWKNVTSVIMNQQISGLTIYALASFIVLFPERHGIIVKNNEELVGFNHLWAIIGYAMGIDDKYNIAIQPDLKTAKKFYKKIYEEVNIPSFFHFNNKDGALALAENALKGFQLINPIWTPNLVLYRTLTCLHQIKAKHVYQLLTPQERLWNFVINQQFHPAFQKYSGMRIASNSVVETMLFSVGITYFGSDYFSRHSKARKVYYS